MSAEPSLIDWVGERASDKADWIEAETNTIKDMYTKARALEIIDEHFGNDGGMALIGILADIASGSGIVKLNSVVQLHKELDRILTIEAAKEAQEKWEDDGL